MFVLQTKAQLTVPALRHNVHTEPRANIGIQIQYHSTGSLATVQIYLAKRKLNV